MQLTISWTMRGMSKTDVTWETPYSTMKTIDITPLGKDDSTISDSMLVKFFFSLLVTVSEI